MKCTDIFLTLVFGSIAPYTPSSGHCDRCHRLSVLYFPFSETTPLELKSEAALLSFAALQDRRALPSYYVIFNVTTRIDSPCSGLSRLLAAAPSYTLQRHIPSCCFCFSPYREGWTANAVFRELAVVDSPLRSALQKPCVCETQEAVMRGRTFGWYVRTPRSTRLLHLYDNNKHASNSYRYAKAPEATATGNWV